MRRVRQWKWPVNGDTRTESKFLWLPMTIRTKDGHVNKDTTRWLEVATWEEVFVNRVGSLQLAHWKPTRWLDLEED